MRLPCRSSCEGKPTAREVQADARGAPLPATAAVIPEMDYQNNAATIYAYTSLQALFDGEAAAGAKAALPGAAGKPVTERPASG
jgi:hypothetical protein